MLFLEKRSINKHDDIRYRTFCSTFQKYSWNHETPKQRVSSSNVLVVTTYNQLHISGTSLHHQFFCNKYFLILDLLIVFNRTIVLLLLSNIFMVCRVHNCILGTIMFFKPRYTVSKIYPFEMYKTKKNALFVLST